VRWSIREHGGEPSSRLVDELLDERAEQTGSRLLGNGPATAWALAELLADNPETVLLDYEIPANSPTATSRARQTYRWPSWRNGPASWTRPA